MISISLRRRQALREGPSWVVGWISLVFATIALLVFCSGAEAISKGTLTGTVSDASGGVAGASVILIGANNNKVSVTTGAGGSYSVEAWPDTYRVGAYPPSGSPDSFASVGGVVVEDGASASAQVVLAAGGATHLLGRVTYPGDPPDAGVEVLAFEEHYGGGSSGPVSPHLTDEAGNWDAGTVVPGFYRVSYRSSRTGADSVMQMQTLGEEVVAVEGPSTSLLRQVEGPLPGGTLEGAVSVAEGLSLTGASLMLSGNGVTRRVKLTDGHFRAVGLSGGTYQVTAEPDQDEDGLPATIAVAVTEGRIAQANLQMATRPGLPGLGASQEQRDLGWLNEERAEWGLPSGVRTVPLWSQACASHDFYLSQNHRLEHPEQADLPGHSAGGQWAGEHAVLSGGGSWSRHGNPWMDAPFHLEQVFAPRLLEVGLDDSNNYQCLTTWPGMNRPPAPAGSVYTFPGNGTVGLPPVEFAGELPKTPNEILGLPPLTGRQLIVWQEGGDTNLESASLSSAGGPVELKTLTGNIGAFLIPIKPLAPFTTYTASVTLGPVGGEGEGVGPAETYRWSFTTGRNNPTGGWNESAESPKSELAQARRLRVGYIKGKVVVAGSGFESGTVAIHAKSRRGKVLSRAEVGRTGSFKARFRWPRDKRLRMKINEGDIWMNGTYRPKGRKAHRREHHPRRGRHHQSH